MQPFGPLRRDGGGDPVVAGRRRGHGGDGRGHQRHGVGRGPQDQGALSRLRGGRRRPLRLHTRPARGAQQN